MNLVAVLLFLTFAFNTTDSGGLRYDELGPLTWNDFKGKPDKKSSYFANTSSGFEYQVAIDGDQLKIFLPCYFNPKESWVKKGKETADLLKHEQLHLDITELNVRKMRKAFFEQKSIKLSEINKISKKIIDQYSKESAQMQKEYDKESNHSINAASQKQWNVRVEKELQKLAAYSNPNIILKIQN